MGWNCATFRTLLSLLLAFTVKQGDCMGISISRMSVPTSMVVGEDGWLECDYKEEGGRIYALKWYLGLDEFYRFTPAESPPAKTFNVPGNPLTVDMQASRRGRVKIHDVKLGAAGVFRCEVSGEAPSFHTDSNTNNMTVVDLPDGKPRISGLKPSYQMHEIVTLNCSSLHSQPPAKLAFYINDNMADPGWLRHYPPLEDEETGLETSVLGLQFPLRPRMLSNRPLAEVKCTASIPDLYWDSSVEQVLGDIPYQASIMEGRAAAGAGRLAGWRQAALLSGLLALVLL